MEERSDWKEAVTADMKGNACRNSTPAPRSVPESKGSGPGILTQADFTEWNTGTLGHACGIQDFWTLKPEFMSLLPEFSQAK